MAAGVTKKEPLNQINKEKILAETVAKETYYQQLYTTFTINPFRKHHLLTPKINTPPEKEHGAEDSHFKAIFQRARLEPTKKYEYPQTTSQEIGWISQPLLGPDRSDPRLFFGRTNSEVTKYMEAVWLMNERSDKKDQGHR